MTTPTWHVWLSPAFSVPETSLCMREAPPPDRDCRCLRAKGHRGRCEVVLDVDRRTWSHKERCPWAPPSDDYRPIETAPKDGTEVEIWLVHYNARVSGDPVGEGWVAAARAHWIDHNHGGWTWEGLAGRPTHWRPLSGGAAT